MSEGKSYIVEFDMGEAEMTSAHPTAVEAQRELERARNAGWALVRILRNYVWISEAELMIDCRAEAEPAGEAASQASAAPAGKLTSPSSH